MCIRDRAWPLIKTRATPAGNNILKMSSPLHNCCVVFVRRRQLCAGRKAHGEGRVRSVRSSLFRVTVTPRGGARSLPPHSHTRAPPRGRLASVRRLAVARGGSFERRRLSFRRRLPPPRSARSRPSPHLPLTMDSMNLAFVACLSALSASTSSRSFASHSTFQFAAATPAPA